MERECGDGVKIWWEERGVGDPSLLLVHGHTGSSTDFVDHVDYLAERRRVVTMDHRGHGQSEHGPPEHYTFDQLTDDLVALIEHVTEGPVDLLGHSMGGRVAMRAALARPDLVRSLILMSTSATGFDDPWAYVSTVTDQLRIRGMSFLDENPYVEPGDWHLTDEMLRSRRANRDALDVEAFIGMSRELSNAPAVLDELAALDIPMAIIVGRRDQLRHASRAMAKAIPQAAFHQLRRAYHFPHLSHQEQWRTIVEEHLASLTATGATS